MSTRYTLPDGVEVPAISGPGAEVRHQWIDHPAYGPSLVAISKLTAVASPLPPMPDAPAFLVDNEVWRVGNWHGERKVIAPQAMMPTPWPRFCEMAREHGWSVVPLVPDPAHGAPELPWQLKEDPWHMWAEVGKVDDDGGAFVKADSRMNPREMRAMASALLRAATESESTSDGAA